MSSPIEFRCETCGKLLRTGAENAGRPAACPACGGRLSVPADLASGEVSAVAPPAIPTPRPRSAVRPHRGGLILAFGILSWMSCFLFGVAAWALGAEDMRAIESGEMDPSGEGLTRAGMLLGAVNVCLMIVMLLGMIGIAGLSVFLS